MLRCLLTRLKRIFCLRQKRQEEEPQPGLFLRIGKAKRWEQDETGKLLTVEDAVLDLKLRPCEKGLSLYRLREESETDVLLFTHSARQRGTL